MLAKKENCTGCGACFNICPKKVIEMKADSEGFLYPEVGEGCNNCGVCEKICPGLNVVVFNEKPREANAVWTNSQEDRARSSSGGFFNILVEYTLSKNGIIFGAAFDGGFNLYHTFGESKEDCLKFAGSKYLQSDIKGTYAKVLKELKGERTVLYSGTPCQIAGLYAFLGKDYDELITCDVVCNGVPSPLVFDKYLKHLENSQSSKAVEVRFKDKRMGWHKPHFTVKFQNGTEFSKNINETEFGRGFGQALFLRPVCGSCQFAKESRVADFTLADFWGLGAKTPFGHKTESGVSLVLINSEKAKEIYKDLPQNFTSVIREFSEATDGNSRLKYPLKHSPNREEFFKAFTSKPFDEVMKTKLAMPGLLYKVMAKVLNDDMKKAIRSFVKK